MTGKGRGNNEAATASPALHLRADPGCFFIGPSDCTSDIQSTCLTTTWIPPSSITWITSIHVTATWITTISVTASRVTASRVTTVSITATCDPRSYIAVTGITFIVISDSTYWRPSLADSSSDPPTPSTHASDTHVSDDDADVVTSSDEEVHYDQYGRIIIVLEGDGFLPSNITTRIITKATRKLYDAPYASWREFPFSLKEAIFNEFKSKCVWEHQYSADVAANFNLKPDFVLHASYMIGTVMRGDSIIQSTNCAAKEFVRSGTSTDG
uniref:Uncharacterized protein n=1 Tax=Nicotiana tabacum TaxID=4097 RepID=A0A1S4AEM0_TOBAC